jgi:hypothetical protein
VVLGLHRMVSNPYCTSSTPSYYSSLPELPVLFINYSNSEVFSYIFRERISC